MSSLPSRQATSDMTAPDNSPDRLLESLQDLLRGPGGAIAIIKNGETFLRHTYGFADLGRRIPLTPQMHMPICSISKHMFCLVLASLKSEPTPLMTKSVGDIWDQASAELQKVLPHLVTQGLTFADLYNMQSGIRDYWAMTTLWGAHPEGPFSILLDAPQTVARTKSFHFQPGTEWSYSNVNFHILGQIIEAVAGQSLGQLLDERVFKPAGMKSAALCPNTYGHPLPVVGYEGDEKHGYVPAVNRIEWAGDAGIVASLDDMIAYEKWLERTYAEAGSLYSTIVAPQTYRDGTAAGYGFGLAHGETAGAAWTSHGGALRGFRLHRIHVPEEHLSVVVLFNHEADSAAPADAIIKRLLQWQEPEKALSTPAPEWQGNFLDTETQLLVHVENIEDGQVSITYHMAPEKVPLTSAVHAESKSIIANIAGDELHVERQREHRTLKARRIKSPTTTNSTNEYIGDYQCAEVSSSFHCSPGSGNLLYGSFDGFLGQGPAHLMQYIGEDVWTLSNPRGMDAPAPGNWTIVFQRDENGKISGVTIGCWLARLIQFAKVL